MVTGKMKRKHMNGQSYMEGMGRGYRSLKRSVLLLICLAHGIKTTLQNAYRTKQPTIFYVKMSFQHNKKQGPKKHMLQPPIPHILQPKAPNTMCPFTRCFFIVHIAICRSEITDRPTLTEQTTLGNFFYFSQVRFVILFFLS